MNKLIDMIDKTRKPLFVCVGAVQSYADGLAPRIGSKLLEAGFEVIGTKDKPVDNLTLTKEKKFVYEIDKSIYQVIAIDITISQQWIGRDEFIIEKGIYPASGSPYSLNNNKIGEIGIIINLSDIVLHQEDLLYPLRDLTGMDKMEFVHRILKKEKKLLKEIKSIFSE